jgi:hypothetical protein
MEICAACGKGFEGRPFASVEGIWLEAQRDGADRIVFCSVDCFKAYARDLP